MKKKGGLGRGLGSLIPADVIAPEELAQPARHAPTVPQAPAIAHALQTGVLQLPASSISPNPRQPRHAIEPVELDELADSIRQHGVIQPVVVTHAGEKNGVARYNLIAGERRWRAAIQAGLEAVPAIVKEASTREMLELALVENLQRSDLNPLEEANAYRSLIDEFGLKQDEIASRVGKSRQAVTNALRLLNLPAPVQEALSLGLIEAGHARAILQAPTEHEQVRLMERTVADHLNVRQVEELARRLAERALGPPEETQPAQDESLYNPVRDLEDRFRTALGTKVQLSKSSRGGKLVIYFYSDEDLHRIYGTIVGEEE